VFFDFLSSPVANALMPRANEDHLPMIAFARPRRRGRRHGLSLRLSVGGDLPLAGGHPAQVHRREGRP
jgi:hypothetical protein